MMRSDSGNGRGGRGSEGFHCWRRQAARAPMFLRACAWSCHLKIAGRPLLPGGGAAASRRLGRASVGGRDLFQRDTR